MSVLLSYDYTNIHVFDRMCATKRMKCGGFYTRLQDIIACNGSLMIGL